MIYTSHIPHFWRKFTMLIRLHFDTVNSGYRRVAPVAAPAPRVASATPFPCPISPASNPAQAASHRNLYIIKKEKRKKNNKREKARRVRWKFNKRVGLSYVQTKTKTKTSYVTSEHPVNKDEEEAEEGREVTAGLLGWHAFRYICPLSRSKSAGAPLCFLRRISALNNRNFPPLNIEY